MMCHSLKSNNSQPLVQLSIYVQAMAIKLYPTIKYLNIDYIILQKPTKYDLHSSLLYDGSLIEGYGFS